MPPPPPLGIGPALPTISDEIERIREGLRLARSGYRQFEQLNAAATATVRQAVTDLKALVSASDDIFRTNGAAAVVQAVKAPRIQNDIKAAGAAQWRAVDQISANVKILQDQVADLLLRNPSDAERARLTALQADLTALLTELTPAMLAGDKTAEFYRQRGIVDYWARLFADLREEGFVLTTYVRCGVTFNRNEQIAVKLMQFDRLPLFDGQPLGTVAVTDPFVTVNCSSPFSISAGVELRFLENQTFGLVPSGAAGANRFGVLESSKTIPLPIGMVHARLIDWNNHRMSLHGSFGVAVHAQGNGSGGSGAEYLVGLSLGLFRTMYITPGWHVGRVAALGGGYQSGDAVPSGVTVVPVRTSYEHGFGLAFTFTKP